MATLGTPAVVTVADLRPGTDMGLALAPGSRLCLQLRSGLGPRRWKLAAGHPGNLVPLVAEDSELSFLVFDGPPATLRLERPHPRSEVVREVCELRIEVSEAHVVAGRRSA